MPYPLSCSEYAGNGTIAGTPKWASTQRIRYAKSTRLIKQRQFPV